MTRGISSKSNFISIYIDFDAHAVFVADQLRTNYLYFWNQIWSEINTAKRFEPVSETVESKRLTQRCLVLIIPESNKSCSLQIVEMKYSNLRRKTLQGRVSVMSVCEIVTAKLLVIHSGSVRYCPIFLSGNRSFALQTWKFTLLCQIQFCYTGRGIYYLNNPWILIT